ncbi:ATPase [Bifidobacterium aemilianum]|uniref:ATPase n=1 Tax=Bifidobacterium aemilianum TaxID=2493120 RepID=A0A366KBE5_9BIFI|nr:ATPase [Bifidobacterium aemilianum]
MLPTVDEFFATSSQVSGGYWPFGTGMALPVVGVPVGRLLSTGAGVCCDPISWFREGIIEQPSMFVMGLPAIGKSTFVRRLQWGLAALGVNCIIPGDLKPDYLDLTRLLNGQVIRLGSGIGSINPLDPGDVHFALQRLDGDRREDLLADYHDRRRAGIEVLLSVARSGRSEGRQAVSDVEANVVATALNLLYDKTKDSPQPPLISDLITLILEGPTPVRAAAVFDDPDNEEAYRSAVSDLVASLHGLSNPIGKFGKLFCRQTTERIDLSKSVDFDISALAHAGDDVVAAVLAVTWSGAFAAKNAADLLSEAGLQPARNHVIIMDELHRALRASPLMVDRLDLVTRLNRQWGVGQIMITHTFADLMCLDTEAQNQKARGFVERSKIKVLGALPSTEINRYLRGESGLPISQREEDMLSDWATPLGYEAQASFKGQGKFLIKTGGLPGLPIQLQMCDLERSGFNDTNLKWHAPMEARP